MFRWSTVFGSDRSLLAAAERIESILSVPLHTLPHRAGRADAVVRFETLREAHSNPARFRPA